MSVTENRIVKMVFDNAQFRKGAADTQKSLADLNKAVDSTGKNKGLLDLDANMQRIGVTASKMAVITTTALATIANKVTNTALQMANSLTFAPIQQGFAEYESLLTKQNVIMNATGKSAEEVKKVLSELNKYSDETIYSFSNMTDSVQKFVNAGVPLDRAVMSIKGIANAAAFAGASAEEANRAMYAFSQSMSLGFIGLQDWVQIENANMGTQQFKKQLLETAVAVGTLRRQGKGYVTESGVFVSATKGWRDGLQEQWATTEVLNKALGKYQLTQKQGQALMKKYNEDTVIAAINAKKLAGETLTMAEKATLSATQVRTFSAFMDTLKESLGSGWSEVFTALIGGLEESTEMWTAFSNVIGGVVEKVFSFMTTAIKTWRSMGGFNKVLQGFGNILAPIGAILKVIGAAWKAAFPNSSSGTGKALYGLSFAFEAITRPLEWLAKLIEQLQHPLAFVFRLFHIGVSAAKAAGVAIGNLAQKLFGMINIDLPSGGGIVDFIKNLAREVSEAVKKIDDLIRKGKSITEAFGSVNIKIPKLPDLPDLGGIFSGKDESVTKVGLLTTGVTKLSSALSDAEKHSQEMSDLIQSQLNPDFKHPEAGKMPDLPETGNMTFNPKATADSFNEAAETMKPAAAKMGGILETLKEKFLQMVQGFNGEDLLASINLAVLATFLVSISRVFNSVAASATTFTDVLDGVGGALGSFQTAARAKLILAIAIAIGILALSLIALSLVPQEKLGNGLVAMSLMLALMAGAIKSLTASVALLDGKKTTPQLLALSVAIIALGLGMLMLAGALALMQLVDWNGIAKGLATMAVLMGGMVAIGKFAQGGSKQILAASLAIATISASMILLAGALLLFKLVDWDDLGKAGAALAGLTVAVGALALIPYQGIGKVGLAMLTASLGIESLARALVIFGFVKWESMAKAGLALAGLTGALALLMVVGNPVAVGGMLGLALGMIGIATAGAILNKVDWESIGKAAVVLGLLVLAAAAFTVMAVVLATVAGPLALLAGALALLAIAIAAMGAAFALVFPLLAAGAGVFAAFATGAAVAIAVFLQTLALQAPIMKDSILKILQAAIDGIVEATPMIIDGVQRFIEAIMKEFEDDNKKTLMGNSGKSWVEKLRDGIAKKIPELVDKAKDLMIRFIRALAEKAASIGAEAAKFVAKFISGIASKIGGVIKAGADLAIKFIQGVGRESARIANAAADVIIDFINKMADTIRTKGPELGDAMGNLGIAMVEGLIGGIGAMFGKAMDKIGGLAEGMVNKAKGILKIFSPSRVFHNIGQFLVMGLTNGIQNNAASAISAVASMVSGQIAVADEYVSRYIQTLDQRAIAARARAEGLAAAAEKAAKAADRTKTKTDDKAADRLAQQAQAAAQQATAAENRAAAAKAQQDRAEQWKEADSFERAQMRSEDAQKQLEAAKAAEARAAKNIAAANALDQQARNRNLTPAQRKKLEAEADRLRAIARRDAIFANQQLEAAKKSAADALVWQQRAGAEAAAAFEEQFKAEAKADADAEAFEAMSNEEKAKARRAEAERLQALAEANLKAAKELAYTDLEEANKLAQQAMAEAEQARQFLDQAEQFENQAGGGGGPMGTVVNVSPTEAAAIAFNQYADLYSSATAAAAATPSVEFNQYNTSPEALSPSEVYRQTNNLLTIAADKLQPVP